MNSKYFMQRFRSKFTRLVSISGIGVVVMGILLSPHVTQANHVQMPYSKLPVGQNVPTTLGLLTGPTYNCVEPQLVDGGFFGETLVAIPHQPEGPYRPNADYDHYVWCPAGTKDKLAKNGINVGEIVQGRTLGDTGPGLDWYEAFAVEYINRLIWLFAVVGAWLVLVMSQLVGPLLTARSFITHPMVISGWPLLQGIANLGFMFALLFIAFSTTLRLDIGGGIKRLLPRLLYGAILINFSLVIAGLFVDFSRVLMAIMYNALTDGGVTSDIGLKLLEKSQLVNSIFDLSTLGFIGLKADATSWSIIFRTLQATILIWTIAAGLIILVGGLLVRYIMLILLLIFSPVAYLAVAFPGGDKLASKWWRKFIQYVLYGPIALFVLLLLVRITSPAQQLLNLNDNLLGSIVMVVITFIMCVGAASAGQYFGYWGSSATLGYINKRGRQLVVGGTKGVMRAGYNVGPKQVIDRTITKPYQDFMAQRKKSLDKKEKDRAAGSAATKYAEMRYASPEKRKLITRDRQWAAEAKGTNDPISPALHASRLRNAEVQKVIKQQQIKAIINRSIYDSDNDDQIEVLVNSPEMVSKMDVEDQNLLIHELKNRLLNPNLDPDPEKQKQKKRDIKDWLKDINNSVREAERRTREKG